MNVARFKVTFAGPLVSFQDGGRSGHMRFGVPASGPMDRFGFAAAQAMLGDAAGPRGIEVSPGGLVLECTDGAVTCAMAGGGFSLNGAAPGWQVVTVHAGDRLTIRGGNWGSWTYLAFSGKIVCNEWLNSSATHMLSGLGGGVLQTGDIFEVRDAHPHAARDGTYDTPDIARPRSEINVVIGPQDQHFSPGAQQTLTAAPYRMTDAFDRMGVRLEGAKLSLADALSIPSEPILRGSVQVAGDGVPVVLLADHQTTGGYPKIATVLSTDTDVLAQMRSGDAFRFRAVSAKDAIALARKVNAVRINALSALSAPRASLHERLMRANLISGVNQD